MEVVGGMNGGTGLLGVCSRISSYVRGVKVGYVKKRKLGIKGETGEK